MLRTVDIIIKKRQGQALSKDEINHMVRGCASGRVPDYQMGAWLMAVFFRGMAFSELAVLTKAMARSGETYDLSAIPNQKVDKHSTGGVGDKVSLALAPLVAATGVPVPMVSGRALGHTGGTLDKLESIPGFQVHLSAERFREQVEHIGVAMIGQSDSIVPADRKMYALRDVTGTVESIPLITASIMSKKMAAGAQALVVDVKSGNGAFLPEPRNAVRLAQSLVAVGREINMPVVALLTDMNQPLGHAVGNAIEVVEAIQALRGQGPDDLRELILALGAEMLVLAEKAESIAAARNELLECLNQGKGLQKFAQMVAAQGGDPKVVEDSERVLGLEGLNEETIHADRDGVVAAFDTRQVGIASMVLGSGRQTVDDQIDPTVGIRIERKLGEKVARSQCLCRILYRDAAKMEHARDILAKAIAISDGPIAPPPLVKSRIDAASLENAQG